MDSELNEQTSWISNYVFSDASSFEADEGTFMFSCPWKSVDPELDTDAKSIFWFEPKKLSLHVLLSFLTLVHDSNGRDVSQPVVAIMQGEGPVTLTVKLKVAQNYIRSYTRSCVETSHGVSFTVCF